MEREVSRKSRSSALNPRTAYFKILMRKGKVQVFRIRRIMLILENLKISEKTYNEILIFSAPKEPKLSLILQVKLL